MNAQRVARALPYAQLAGAIGDMFLAGPTAPRRGHHTIAIPGERDATLLLMPAWTSGGYLGVKLATVFPDAGRHGRESVDALYVLIDAVSGERLALLDGAELTARRTAATSALAAQRLARRDASRLLVIGAGRLAGGLARAHAALRPGLTVEIWARRADRARGLARTLRREGLNATAAGDLSQAMPAADIVSCATLAHEPVAPGKWLSPGAHLDLVGGFTPHMRETDDEAVGRAKVFCDTYAALSECGDLAGPIAAGRLSVGAVADLADLLGGAREGRTSDDQITLYKSVGCAPEDLAAAIMAYEAQKQVRIASTT